MIVYMCVKEYELLWDYDRAGVLVKVNGLFLYSEDGNKFRAYSGVAKFCKEEYSRIMENNSKLRGIDKPECRSEILRHSYT